MSIATQQSGPAIDAPPRTGDHFLALLSLGLAAVLAVYQVVTAPFIPVLTVFTVFFGVVGVGIHRSRRRWLVVVAGMLALVYLVGGAPVLAEHLAHPESPLGFLADALLVIGLMTLLLAAVGSLRGAGPGYRRSLVTGASALAVVAVGVCVVAVSSVESADRRAEDVAVDVVDWVYPDVSVPASAAALWVDNRDPFHHTLLIEGTDVRAVLPASTAVRVPLDLAPGSYRYLCDVPGHDAMRGTLRVP